MRKIRTDLWETRIDTPFPGLTTHAYLWTGSKNGNVLFYSPATATEFDKIDRLGGVAHQYLSHQDEAGPMLGQIAARFGAALHAPKAELTDIGKHQRVDVVLENRHVDDNGIEVIPTPGHTEGSTSYLVTSADGSRYLFVGDTVFEGDDGRWAAGYLPPMSDAEQLAGSLRELRTVSPDVVISSAAPNANGAHVMSADSWANVVYQALDGLERASTRSNAAN